MKPHEVAPGRAMIRVFAIAVALLLTTHRLPAPIQEQSPVPARSKESAARQFSGTWVANFSRDAANEREITYSYTIVIKESKAAIKNMDITIVSRSGAPLYGAEREMRAVWTCTSANVVPTAESLTIEWNAIQLSTWTPRSIPQEIVQNFSPPSGATISVYAIKGDELTRINPPEGVAYHRIR